MNTVFLAVSDEDVFIIPDIPGYAKAYDRPRVLCLEYAKEIDNPMRFDEFTYYAIKSKFHKFVNFQASYTYLGEPWISARTYSKFIGFQESLSRIPASNIQAKMKAVNENALALTIELGEMMNELPHKPWRNIALQPFNEPEALEEYIDMFFFMFNIGIAMYWTYPELILVMAYKYNKNLNRIKGGYNNINDKNDKS